MGYVTDFFAGAFLCNCIPHVVAGMLGMPFPTPFAKPSGVGNSSPLLNVLWGALNLLVGLGLLSRSQVTLGANPDFAFTMAGVLALGIFAALHFGKVRREKPAGRLEQPW